MLQSELQYLLERYLLDTISEEERNRLRLLLKQPENLHFVDEKIMNELANQTYLIEPEPHVKTVIDTYIAQHAGQRISNSRRIPVIRKWGWVAASILLILGTVVYKWLATNNAATEPIGRANATRVISPGKDGAILTLADGSQVVLDSLGDGLIAAQNGSDAVLHNGSLAYNLTDKTTETVVYNTINTPNGRQFAMTLPDGTRVWLNASSSIRYPTVFGGQARSVVVTGEVYMEVAVDKSKPFLVTALDMEVQVLGTSFNINAYSDEPAIRTTLLDGRIRVFKKEKELQAVIVEPGQQVVVKEHVVLHKGVDVEQIMAWRNGVFNLEGATLEEFMRQLARWYDLKVIYRGTIPHEIFKGEIGRDLELSQILKVLKQFNVHYQLSGKTITIESR